MKYAQIKDNIVINVIVWDGVSPYPSGDLVPVNSYCQIGYSYINGEFIPPVEEILEE